MIVINCFIYYVEVEQMQTIATELGIFYKILYQMTHRPNLARFPRSAGARHLQCTKYPPVCSLPDFLALEDAAVLTNFLSETLRCILS